MFVTINFSGDIMIDPDMRKYTKDSIFILGRQLKSGLYLLQDMDGEWIKLPKRNINFEGVNNGIKQGL